MLPTPEEIRVLFDRIAPVYDQLNDWLSLGQHRVWKTMAANWTGPFQGATCLDLCCGSGDLARILAQRVGPNGQVYGVDFAAEQLRVARQRTQASSQVAGITWVEADALELPFEDRSFDAIAMGYGLRNVTSIPGCLQEIYRVLKPGCKAAILDFHQPQNPWLQTFQQWYLQTIVVPAAARFGLTEEYAYLGPSLKRFPSGTEQVSLARAEGFNRAIHYPIAGGLMGVLVLTH